MRYDGTAVYENAAGLLRWWKNGVETRGSRYGPDEPAGTFFCYTAKGTGVNAADRPGGPKAGDATVGQCRYQFCVNDQKH